MAKKLRVGVLFGGRSGEHEVSLLSAASILKAIDRKKFDVVPIGITKEGHWLAAGEATVGELAEPFSMTQPAVSKHLKVLEKAGLISRGRDAQRRPRRLEAKPLAEANEWLEGYRQFWEASFQRLDALLGEMKLKEKKRKHTKR